MQTQRGALLIEHLIALGILAVAVASVSTLLSVGYLAENLAQDQSTATNLAQRKMEELRARGFEAATSLARQPIDPSAFEGYDWQVEVAEVAPQFKEITATVYWNSHGRERSVTLVTALGGR
jgi:Tfp pilus assembly protein PilV